MKIIPIITIKKRENLKITTEHLKIKNIKNTLDKYQDKLLYLYDLDGINKNKPNLCLFQKLSKNHELWVDAGPRKIGDIVDSIISGASKITVRLDLIDISEILGIDEILENEIYINISNKKNDIKPDNINKDLNYLIQYNNRVNINQKNKNFEYLLDYLDEKSYFYINSKNDIKRLKKINIAGYLVDIEKVEEYQNIGI